MNNIDRVGGFGHEPRPGKSLGELLKRTAHSCASTRARSAACRGTVQASTNCYETQKQNNEVITGQKPEKPATAGDDPG